MISHNSRPTAAACGVTAHRRTLNILLVFVLATCIWTRGQRRDSTQHASAQKVCIDIRSAGGGGRAEEVHVDVCKRLVLYEAAVGMEVRPAALAQTAEALEESGCGAVGAHQVVVHHAIAIAIAIAATGSTIRVIVRVDRRAGAGTRTRTRAGRAGCGYRRL